MSRTYNIVENRDKFELIMYRMKMRGYITRRLESADGTNVIEPMSELEVRFSEAGIDLRHIGQPKETRVVFTFEEVEGALVLIGNPR